MEFWEHLDRQRVRHIVSSYRLEGDESNNFETYLRDLLSAHPAPLVELALVEVLVEHWYAVPLPRGLSFLSQVRQKLKGWENQCAITSHLTPAQFQQITGLNPAPIFGPSYRSQTQAARTRKSSQRAPTDPRP